MTFYDRDPTVPFWRSNVDVDALFENHSHRPERAQAWLRYRDVSESCAAFRQAVVMRGHFESGLLGYHTYCWTFTPSYTGDLAIVLPVYEDCRLVDLLAISRHDHSVWGCCTGAGQFVGSTAVHRKTLNSPLRVYKTPINWLLANCEGIAAFEIVLPLAATRVEHHRRGLRARLGNLGTRFYGTCRKTFPRL
jgi:hypothetical protein